MLIQISAEIESKIINEAVALLAYKLMDKIIFNNVHQEIEEKIGENKSIVEDIGSEFEKIEKMYQDIGIDTYPKPKFRKGTSDKTDRRGIYVLNLPVRANNVLKHAGISQLHELTNKTSNDIRSLKNCGIKTINEIESKLAEIGLKLREDI